MPAENSLHYFLALRRAGVPAEMHIFEKGAHGVGLANDNAALAPWSTLLANWLRGPIVHQVIAMVPFDTKRLPARRDLVADGWLRRAGPPQL